MTVGSACIAMPIFSRFKYTAATIESIKCEAEACKVELMVTYDYPVQGKIMKGIRTPASETWVLDKGAAWLVYL